MAKLIIVRGLPGSGKSTTAKAMLYSGVVDEHFEADNYFVRLDGIYDFNPRLLKEAHDWCYELTINALFEACNVVVSNTFTTWKEIERYAQFAKCENIKIELFTLTENYGSIHNVPEDTMKRMRYRFESHESILEKMDYA